MSRTDDTEDKANAAGGLSARFLQEARAVRSDCLLVGTTVWGDGKIVRGYD